MDEFDPDVGKRPQFDAPAIAELMRRISRRPVWQGDEPLLVDSETFARARTEMHEIQQRQGRTLPVAPWIAQDNFLLRGTPVVSE